MIWGGGGRGSGKEKRVKEREGRRKRIGREG